MIARGVKDFENVGVCEKYVDFALKGRPVAKIALEVANRPSGIMINEWM